MLERIQTRASSTGRLQCQHTGLELLGPTAGRVKTESSLSCVCNVEKRLLKAAPASDSFSDMLQSYESKAFSHVQLLHFSLGAIVLPLSWGQYCLLPHLADENLLQCTYLWPRFLKIQLPTNLLFSQVSPEAVIPAKFSLPQTPEMALSEPALCPHPCCCC